MSARRAPIRSAAELSHLLGYVAPVSPDDKKTSDDDDPLLDLPGFRIGKRGIEKQFDDARCAARRARAASRSTPMAASSASCASDPATPGKDVYLTIDRELQHFADQRLARRKLRPAS